MTNTFTLDSTEQTNVANLQYQNIPHELIDLCQWVTWRYETRDGKPTKVPYNARTGQRADSTGPTTWCDFETACIALAQNETLNGIGFVATDFDPFIGVDLDHHLTGGVLSDDARRWVDSLDSYTEVTPSGDGLRVWIKANKPGDRCKNAKARVEIYNTGRFFTVTGNHLAGTPTTIQERQDGLNALYGELFPPTTETKRTGPENGRGAVVDIPFDDRDLLGRMFASKNGGTIRALFDGDTSGFNGDESAADQALCNHLAWWTGKDAERMGGVA